MHFIDSSWVMGHVGQVIGSVDWVIWVMGHKLRSIVQTPTQEVNALLIREDREPAVDVSAAINSTRMTSCIADGGPARVKCDSWPDHHHSVNVFTHVRASRKKI